MDRCLSLSGPDGPSYRLERRIPFSTPGLPFFVPACFIAFLGGAGILTCFPSPTPFGLGLGADLPMGGLSFPRKPWAYGERVSHSLYRYSCLHKLSTRPSPVVSVQLVSPCRCSPTTLIRESAASVLCLSPVTFSAQARSTSELLRFL